MRTVISKDGTPIAFDQSGQGPAIILVAGATATRLAEASLASALAPHFTVFAYDRRGRGESGDTAPYAALLVNAPKCEPLWPSNMSTCPQS